jgi:hypothetical protein
MRRKCQSIATKIFICKRGRKSRPFSPQFNFETLGPWCKEVIDFINIIGNRLIAESGNSKSKKLLFERISLAIQRGNSASIRGTFPDSTLFSEIFVL